MPLVTSPPRPTPDHRWRVVIPAFNAENTIARAVRSAASQLPISQVLVVNDGSTDQTAHRAASLGAKVFSQPNAGPARARNTALDTCRGDHVLFLDADDELAHGALDALRRLASAHPEHACIIGSHDEQPASTAAAPKRRAPRPDWIAAAQLPDPLLALGTDHVFCTTGLCVSPIVSASPTRFNPALRFGEDRDFIARAGALATILITDHRIVIKHLVPERLTASPAQSLRWLRDQIALLDLHAPPGASPQALAIMRPALEWTAKNTLRSLARQQTTLPSADWHALRQAFRARGWRIPISCHRLRIVALLASWNAAKSS